jgi:hypothetical protein
MQTFLPYPSFAETARVLDTKRLNKQQVENQQILTALLEGRGWVNHPAVKMWAGHEFNLMQYQDALWNEWHNVRGYNDHASHGNFHEIFELHMPMYGFNEAPPSWMGNVDFHISHQSNLVRKDFHVYGPLFPDVPDNLEYVWPV